jgi:hypothetical protein
MLERYTILDFGLHKPSGGNGFNLGSVASFVEIGITSNIFGGCLRQNFALAIAYDSCVSPV